MTFRDELASGEPQYGLWLGMASGYAAEICAGSGADWLLIDGEHAPNTLTTVLAQLQGANGRDIAMVARTPDHNPTTIKQYLDMGITNLLVPSVDTPRQAHDVVAATRYPPHGVRGVASTLSRAADFGRRSDYLRTAHEDLCLFVQIESVTALESVQEIARVPGVDGIFVGPADLAASMGHLGNPRHPAVIEAVGHVLEVAQQIGVFAGLFASSPADGRSWAAKGACLVAIGSDIGVLQRGTQRLVGEARGRAYSSRL